MRLLYVTNGFPFPLTSGYLRHYHFIRELSSRHAITLLSICGDRFEPRDVEGIAPFVEQVHTFRGSNGSRSLSRKLRDRLDALSGGGVPAVRELGCALRRLAGEQPYDAMIFSGKQTLPALAGLDRLPVVVDVCDAASLRILGALRYSPPAALPMRAFDYVQGRRVERALSQRGDHLLFASSRDRDWVLGRTSRPATVVSNGVDVEFWKRTGKELGRDTIVFTGAMHYPPNVDAAVHLIQDILPRVQRVRSGARAVIVGRDPAPRLKALAGRPGVTVTGYVDDVRPYLERATLFAAPLRFGAGIQNKLLEALAFALPVVASPQAADGLRMEDGGAPPVELASGPAEFAERIARQLSERACRPKPAREGRDFVARNFVWSRSAQKIEDALSSVVESRRGGE